MLQLVPALCECAVSRLWWLLYKNKIVDDLCFYFLLHLADAACVQYSKTIRDKMKLLWLLFLNLATTRDFCVSKTDLHRNFCAVNIFLFLFLGRLLTFYMASGLNLNVNGRYSTGVNSQNIDGEDISSSSFSSASRASLDQPDCCHPSSSSPSTSGSGENINVYCGDSSSSTWAHFSDSNLQIFIIDPLIKLVERIRLFYVLIFICMYLMIIRNL